MMPRLEYKDIIKAGTHNRFLYRFLDYLFGESESIWQFLNESLQLHEAPILERLIIELGPHCPVDVDVVKWISNAVDRGVSELEFDLMWSAKPTSLPKNLYICNTLVYLRLSNKVFVDVASPLYVERHDQDNLIKFRVQVPSLETLVYTNEKSKAGSLIINSAILKNLFIVDISRNSCSIESKPCLDNAFVYVTFYPDDKFMRSLSSVMHLELMLINETVACCQTINFSRLIECKILVVEFDWFEPFVALLQHSPKLKAVFINLQRAGISLKSTWKWNKKKIMKELKSMYRISTTCQLLFSTQLEFEP
ncbi:unnamed protein product [Arabidopsis lyrata]|uniref:FBD domain-containing protein n=1 Tax=Arabidopsis lyrata subsp. lyrata TaxID=81972 RepID=D7MJ61_ARALL|nr:hypothetical protein ARALYDRAFT_916178 [Arabidopsis lyrata subsp. lyrata]CAH8277672.1 unnamed protein product [Arabidopsis lyrata]